MIVSHEGASSEYGLGYACGYHDREQDCGATHYTEAQLQDAMTIARIEERARVIALADEWDAIEIRDEWHAADLWHEAPERLRVALNPGAAA